MKSRAQELREQHRRVLRWSIGVAVLLHVVAFVTFPGFRTEVLPFWSPRAEPVNRGGGTPIYVEVVFGPPDIFRSDGSVSREPPERELEANRLLRLPAECAALARAGRLPARGRVRVRAWGSGRTDVVELVESTGSDCGDEAITAVADALWYRWLPDERFPAPVDLIQPVTLVLARN